MEGKVEEGETLSTEAKEEESKSGKGVEWEKARNETRRDEALSLGIREVFWSLLLIKITTSSKWCDRCRTAIHPLNVIRVWGSARSICMHDAKQHDLNCKTCWGQCRGNHRLRYQWNLAGSTYLRHDDAFVWRLVGLRNVGTFRRLELCVVNKGNVAKYLFINSSR